MGAVNTKILDFKREKEIREIKVELANFFEENGNTVSIDVDEFYELRRLQKLQRDGKMKLDAIALSFLSIIRYFCYAWLSYFIVLMFQALFL